MRIFILSILILIQSCGDRAYKIEGTTLQKLNYFSGYWQNIDKPHNFICFIYSYPKDSVQEAKGGWGSFPLELDSLNPNQSDTAKYYQNFCFMGGYSFENDIISCWYKDLNNQGVILKGEIKIIGDNKIITPAGKFKKLSKEEVTKINPLIK